MEDKLYDVLKCFEDFHESLEDMLDTACRKAKTENNADLMQKLTDLEDTARFIEADLGDYSEILNTIKEMLKQPKK